MPESLAYDEFAFEHIRPAWLDDEAALFDTKWFDYRFMHPTQATYVYADAYEKAWRQAAKTNFDIKMSQSARVANSKNLSSQKAVIRSGIWRGRMISDGLGIPYDEFLRLAFEERLRQWGQRFMPPPTNLYSEGILQEIHAGWIKLQEVKIWYSENPNYLARKFAGLPHQVQHMEFIREQAAKRPDRESIILKMHAKGLLTDDYLPATPS